MASFSPANAFSEQSLQQQIIYYLHLENQSIWTYNTRILKTTTWHLVPTIMQCQSNCGAFCTSRKCCLLANLVMLPSIVIYRCFDDVFKTFKLLGNTLKTWRYIQNRSWRHFKSTDVTPFSRVVSRHFQFHHFLTDFMSQEWLHRP